MAIEYRCDRCDAVVKNYTAHSNKFKLPSIIKVVDTKATEAGAGFTEFDLCDMCVSNLRLWLGMEQVARIPER